MFNEKFYGHAGLEWKIDPERRMLLVYGPIGHDRHQVFTVLPLDALKAAMAEIAADDAYIAQGIKGILDASPS